jgi:phage-related protein
MIKTVVFEGDSLEVIRAFPDSARQRAGYEIDRIQNGLEPLNWKPFPSIGAGVREIRIQVGMQYRVIYVAKYGGVVHVLHAFQKKTQKTLKSDSEIAWRRMRQVIRRYAE